MAGLRQIEDFVVYQLSAQLRDEIFDMTEAGAVLRHQRFREQIRDSSSSAPRNLSEGFGYFRPRQFAKYARIALGSLHETRTHLHDGRRKRYCSAQDSARLLTLTRRAITGTTRLLCYLESCGDTAPTGWPPRTIDREPGAPIRPQLLIPPSPQNHLNLLAPPNHLNLLNLVDP